MPLLCLCQPEPQGLSALDLERGGTVLPRPDHSEEGKGKRVLVPDKVE